MSLVMISHKRAVFPTLNGRKLLSWQAWFKQQNSNGSQAKLERKMNETVLNEANCLLVLKQAGVRELWWSFKSNH